MNVNLVLTEEQADLLLEVLEDHWDRGPYNEGWQSEELIALNFLVNEAIDLARS